MLKYIGSKRLLVDKIVKIARVLPDVETVLDLFSGTSRVAHGLKDAGFFVTANDHLTYASMLAKCYVEADRQEYVEPTRDLLDQMGRADPLDGYVTRVFCNEARYFQPHNGRRIDGMLRWLEEQELDPIQEAILRVSLMEAADRVDSTTGVQMAYLKDWAARSYNDLKLRMPAMLPGPGKALQLDAAEAADKVTADLAYLDPPYNQHSYMGNYHIWETLARGDQPEHYGKACKRIDCRDYQSPFNSKRKIHDAMADVLEALDASYILVSFNNEGFISEEEMIEMLTDHGHIAVAGVDHKRYVGAKIGIYNPSGEKVGKVGHTTNKENLFLVGQDRDVVEGALREIAGPEQRSLDAFQS